MNEPKKAKILVVDDELPLREFLTDVLTEEGYEIITAEDGLQAIDRAASEQPDLILLDILMPRLDGMATCKKLRSHPMTKNIRVIFLTAFNSRDRLEEAIDANADDFLGKPINTVELCVRVRSMLNVRHIPDEVDRLEEYVKTMKSLRPRPQKDREGSVPHPQ